MNVKGAIAALKAYHAATKGDVVDPEEVNARLKVCQTGFRGKVCPKFKPAAEFMNKASKRLGELSGEHGVPPEIADKACGVCGCSMMLLMPAKPENLHQDSPEQAAKRPSFCWLKQYQKKR